MTHTPDATLTGRVQTPAPRSSARPGGTSLLAAAFGIVALAGVVAPATASAAGKSPTVVRAALASGKINHILVIELENEGYNATFGAGSPATYLNGTLRPKGELLQNYYATGHDSLDNYIAQVSGQAPTEDTQADCADNGFAFANVAPGTPDANQRTNPGQVDGEGCVYPASVKTIASQLDAKYPPNKTTHVAAWRAYEQDMGNTPARDGGMPDQTGGTDCAHPSIGATDTAEVATPTDQYTTRHNPFVWFHSIIDNTAECNANVVPLGTLGADGTPSPTGHLAEDLRSERTTPAFWLHHAEPVRRRPRRHLRRSQQYGRARRWPHGGRRVPARMDAAHPGLARLRARRHARRDHVRRVRCRRSR